MNKMLEKIWDNHFAEECAVVSTEEERRLIGKTGDAHSALNESLTKEQKELMEKYIDALYETQELFIKKAFFKGCEFAVSFCIEMGIL